MSLSSIEPKVLWENFSKLNAVPRPSKKEEQVIAFMVDFGKSLQLETLVDPVGNVIIKKPAKPGMEHRKTVVLQSHLDMVHQKNNDTDFDFATQGIEMMIEGDWVKAKGTTLGADNGLGVAAIMTVLASDTIAHPALEALFTIDEETGMTGAMGLEPGYLTGEILLNLDTEEDDEIGVGCAGGIDVTATKTYQALAVDTSASGYEIKVTGLQGGHSGMDIHKGLGNANKLMNRVLFALLPKIGIASIDGGGLRNAIPRESTARVTSEVDFQADFNQIRDEILAEYSSLEPELNIMLEPCDRPKSQLSSEDAKTLISTIYALPNGVFRMSPDIENLVETSNNVARVSAKDGQIEILCLTRSSVASGKTNLTNQIEAILALARFTADLSGAYPGWKPNPNSAILQVLQKTYKDLFKEPAQVLACHAGLECGILGQHYPAMDMISFGPTIKGAHSPDERASISSTQKFWRFLTEILAQIPEKA